MRLSRREWLVRATGVAAGAALIYGLPALSAAGGEEPTEKKTPKRPPWLDEALAEMRRTKAPGVAIVVPVDDGTEERKKEREALRAAIATLMSGPSYEAKELLVEAVWVCVPGAFVEAKPGETAVLIEALADGGAKRVAGSTMEFSSEKEFVEGAAALLRGERRLEERAKKARTEEVARQIARLLGTDDEWQDALPRLTETFPTVRAAVIQARIDAKEEEHRARLQQVVESYYLQQALSAASRPVRHLPFGAKWEREQLPADAPDPCPPCGMAVVLASGRVLLEFLTEAKQAK